ncbi:MAG: amidohydrolase family protein [Deltaproteobacteria bacterium]|nr:amidohydrolase family protein [Deltaproteobacteria bacterium]
MKEKADIILKGGTVITMDKDERILVNADIAVLDGEIKYVGDNAALRFSAATVIDCSGRIVMPGLINAHTHLPMSLVRGIADDLRLDVWLYGYIFPVEKNFVNKEFCRWGSLLSALEMIKSGTTCFVDMYYYEDVIAGAASELGMRGICGETVLKFPSPDALSYDIGFKYARAFIEEWHGHRLITPAIAPHAPYTCTPEILREAKKIAEDYNIPVLIHISEPAFEVENARKEWGMSPVEYLESLGLFEVKTIAAHCVHVNEKDMKILAKRHVGVSHNPTSNLKLASGIAPVSQMIENGIDVAIGTDGAGSNNDHDMIEEMRLAALLPKGLLFNPTVVPAKKVIRMSTIEGARAVGLDGLIGSVEVGKRADLITLDLSGVHNIPQYNILSDSIYSRIVYAAKSSDVNDVIIDGKVIMLDRKIITMDEDYIIKHIESLAGDITAFMHKRESSLVDKLLAIGGIEWKETFEVQVKTRVEGTVNIDEMLASENIKLIRKSTRDQFDTYLLFNNSTAKIRYREDEVTENGKLIETIYTLTLVDRAYEKEFPNFVLLSGSCFSSIADKSLRFYREYFQPDNIFEINKKRKRYRILYKGIDFAINVDEITNPREGGFFVEIKSRTWSENDAIKKAALISELIQLFRLSEQNLLKDDYTELFLGG